MEKEDQEKQKFLVIGTGIAGLTTACLLAEAGHAPLLLEQNWLPGGCASSYPRKHYIFESGATTLVGLDPGMPLQYLSNKIDLHLDIWQLQTPMKVYTRTGKVITRHQGLSQWIEEAEQYFGPQNQRAFWEKCYDISRFVWDSSIKQRAFPPENLKDLLQLAKNFRPNQLRYAAYAFQSMQDFMAKYGLDQNPEFVDFVNEQLIITAQNEAPEVNVLFGATALCYTNYGNYYVPGGLIKLVEKLVAYIEEHGGKVILREPVVGIERQNGHYKIQGKKATYETEALISSIPINNTLDLLNGSLQKTQAKVLDSTELASAYSLGFVAKKRKDFTCIHHQIHLPEPLPYLNSKSIFLSLSHPKDTARCGPDEIVGSVSTHVHDPQNRWIEDKDALNEAIFDLLEQRGLIAKEDITFHHASTPKAWKKWTGRAWGFVGGYPQLMRIKPWNMNGARLDGYKAYICGDSTYPGQGIPGACLSGIVAFEKMKLDGLV